MSNSSGDLPKFNQGLPEPINEVVIGEGNELFLASTGRDTLAFIRGHRTPAEIYGKIFRENMAGRTAHAAEMGAKYFHLVAPDKHMVYREQFPEPIKFGFAQWFKENSWEDFVYVDEFLRSFLPERMYLQTDTHWTLAGTIRVVGLIAKQFGTLPDEEIDRGVAHLLSRIAPMNRPYSGDLGSKLEPTQEEPRERISFDWEFEKADNGVQHNEGVMRVVKSKSPFAKGKLLIFGDSYMVMGIDILGFFFKEVMVCRSRYYHREVVYASRPDYILTENVERYFGVVRPDKDAPPLFLIPFLLGRQIEVSVEAAQMLAHFLKG